MLNTAEVVSGLGNFYFLVLRILYVGGLFFFKNRFDYRFNIEVYPGILLLCRPTLRRELQNAIVASVKQ